MALTWMSVKGRRSGALAPSPPPAARWLAQCVMADNWGMSYLQGTYRAGGSGRVGGPVGRAARAGTQEKALAVHICHLNATWSPPPRAPPIQPQHNPAPEPPTPTCCASSPQTAWWRSRAATGRPVPPLPPPPCWVGAPGACGSSHRGRTRRPPVSHEQTDTPASSAAAQLAALIRQGAESSSVPPPAGLQDGGGQRHALHLAQRLALAQGGDERAARGHPPHQAWDRQQGQHLSSTGA